MAKKSARTAKATGRTVARGATTGKFVTRSVSRKTTRATSKATKTTTGRYVNAKSSRGTSIVFERSPAGRGTHIEIDPLLVKVAVIADALGSKAKTAEFLGVARSQPGRWLAGDERPNPRARRLIQDFEYVWARLTDERTPDAAHIWLVSANAFLDGATPLTWLRTRGPDEVITALDAEEAGSYA